MANYTGNGTKSLHTSLKASLKKLNTDYIDLLYVHWWDFSASVGLTSGTSTIFRALFGEQLSSCVERPRSGLESCGSGTQLSLVRTSEKGNK